MNTVTHYRSSQEKSITKLTIQGFMSIEDLQDLRLGQLNVLIGANGAGKSNLVSFFRMLGEMIEQRLAKWVAIQGTADRVLCFGAKHTRTLRVRIEFGYNAYWFELESDNNGAFVFESETLHFEGLVGLVIEPQGSGHREAKLKDVVLSNNGVGISNFCYRSISSWRVYHFHDTTAESGMKRIGAVHDNQYLRPHAENLAAFLYRLLNEQPDTYSQIRETIRLAIPFFDDFVLRPITLETQEEVINLRWRQRGSDYELWPTQLSDGSLRFVCLVVALLQPQPPATIVIDEPELGLHPYAITLLASLIRSASTRMQVIITTQSVSLVNEFSISDLIVVEQVDGVSTFTRHDEGDFASWLNDYTVGDLWQKNLFGGRPR
jgi:predicted ATPase